MPKISVIIPVYNVEKYLKQCLDSAVGQTLKDIEIICINDGSTDNSLKILQQYASLDDRIKVISQENSGLSATRNKAIKLATGEYIAFLDSDDWIEHNFYEELYKTAKKYNSDIAAGNITLVSDKNDYWSVIKYKKESYAQRTRKKYKLAHIPDHNYVWNKIYDRVKLQKMNLTFEEGVLFEDIMFSHKVVYYMKHFATTPKTTYYYRNNKYSIVNVDSESAMKQFYIQCEKALKFIQDNDIRTNNYKKHINYKWSNKKTYSILNIPILTIKTYGYHKFYHLFGIIPIFQYRVSNRKNIYTDQEEL